ncbi:MAG: MarR family transcriptional regulator [Spirochaetota bacterium]
MKFHSFVYKYLLRIADNIDLLTTELLQNNGLKGLGRSHLEILTVLLRKKEMTLSEIALHIERRKATVTVLIKKLEKLGYCQRKVNENDQRSFYISLTPKGQQTKRVAFRIFSVLNQSMEAAFSTKESETLQNLLFKLYQKTKANSDM